MVEPPPFHRCPKCGHQPLPADQAFPADCPACGVILARVRERLQHAAPAPVLRPDIAPGPLETSPADETPWPARLMGEGTAPVDSLTFGSRCAILAWLAVWGLLLARDDPRTGEIGSSFLHGPLLVFHEAGHFLFRPLGEWMAVAGGTLGQLLMPVVLGGALLWRNRDPFGAAVALWLLGVSLLDCAPYCYDALEPQLTLLSGQVGEAGGHDWIFLLGTTHLLERAQSIGLGIRAGGVVVVLVAVAWGGCVLWRQSSRIGGAGVLPP